MISFIHEHYNGFDKRKAFDFEGLLPFTDDFFYHFNKDEEKECYRIYSDKDNLRHFITNKYFIGVDWVIENRKAIYIAPKIDENRKEKTDYLKMLFSALEHPDVLSHTEHLFEIRWDKNPIEITQQQDLLTPLLIVQFLKLVKDIVRKGLKKSYYKVEQNLYGKVKGKINVGQSIKKNVVQNKPLDTFCSYEEFGYNGVENRLLKKALRFVQHYLPTFQSINTEASTNNIFSYVYPAFSNVSENVLLSDIKHSKPNVFYKEYLEAVKLAKIILKRFGYNIANIQQTKIKTAPFWIDMSKLFELYVLGQLKEKYGNEILYGDREAKAKYGLPDYLLTKSDEITIIDAKYKPMYQDKKYDIENIRQLSGYGRDVEVLKKLGFKEKSEQAKAVVKCLLIYPDQDKSLDLWKNDEIEVNGFIEFYKRAIRLPVIKQKVSPFGLAESIEI